MVPITFEVDGQPTHTPMINSMADGVATRFILDTGSTDHVWTRHFVDQLDVESGPTEPGTDHAGASTPTWTVGRATVHVAGVALSVSDVVAIEGPPQFWDWGVGGFLSPQRLTSDFWVMLDLVSDQLSLVALDPSKGSAWIDDAFPGLKHLVLERKSSELLVVDASVEPHVPVATMINTGTEESEFASHAVPRLRGDYEVRGRGASGAETGGQVVADQVLRTGETRIEIPSLLVRETMPEPPGMIGMDTLKNTVLVISPKPNDPVHWLVPR